MSRCNAQTSGADGPLRKKMQFKELNVVSTGGSTETSAVGHVLSALK